MTDKASGTSLLVTNRRSMLQYRTPAGLLNCGGGSGESQMWEHNLAQLHRAGDICAISLTVSSPEPKLASHRQDAIVSWAKIVEQSHCPIEAHC